MVLDYAIVLAAAITAVSLESLYRWHQGTFAQIFPLVVIPALFLTFGVFKAMKLGDSLLSSIILFNLTTASARLFTTYFVLHEQPRPATLVGFGLVVCAHLISKFWR